MKSRCDFEVLAIETPYSPNASPLLPNLRQDSLHFRSRHHRFTVETTPCHCKSCFATARYPGADVHNLRLEVRLMDHRGQAPRSRRRPSCKKETAASNCNRFIQCLTGQDVYEFDHVLTSLRNCL